MTTRISSQSWSAPAAHMCNPAQHVANSLQRLSFEFFRQGPLLLVLKSPRDSCGWPWCLPSCKEGTIWPFRVFTVLSYYCYYF